jgi:hypothetical protein
MLKTRPVTLPPFDRRGSGECQEQPKASRQLRPKTSLQLACDKSRMREKYYTYRKNVCRIPIENRSLGVGVGSSSSTFCYQTLPSFRLSRNRGSCLRPGRVDQRSVGTPPSDGPWHRTHRLSTAPPGLSDTLIVWWTTSHIVPDLLFPPFTTKAEPKRPWKNEREKTTGPSRGSS